MEIVKKEKGITLVALIITVIVLLILAVVTISSIQGDGGVVKYAQDAADGYTIEQGRESDVIQKYADELIPEIGFKIGGANFSVKEGTTLAQFIGEGKELELENAMQMKEKYYCTVNDEGNVVATTQTNDEYVLCKKVSKTHTCGGMGAVTYERYVIYSGNLELKDAADLELVHKLANSDKIVNSGYVYKCTRDHKVTFNISD